MTYINIRSLFLGLCKKLLAPLNMPNIHRKNLNDDDLFFAVRKFIENFFKVFHENVWGEKFAIMIQANENFSKFKIPNKCF